MSEKPLHDADPGIERSAQRGPSDGSLSSWPDLGLSGLADDVVDGIERIRAEASSAFESSIRLGVTGLSGAGKTVFITALIANLLSRERLLQFPAGTNGRIRAAMIRPQPDDDVPRFAYEAHVAALRADPPAWPVSTRSVSQLRLSLALQPRGIIEGVSGLLGEVFGGGGNGPVLNIDIVDYPGEWLLDLPLMDLDYERWSADALSVAESPVRRTVSAGFRDRLTTVDPGARHDEAVAQDLAAAWTQHLRDAQAAGLSRLAPGRFLMPGDIAGSPMLVFAPLPRPERSSGRGRGTLFWEMRRRFDAYRRHVVRPFFRNHFARLDRQVVLVDPLPALERGAGALADQTDTLRAILSAFRHGRSGWLDRLLGGRRIDRILVAATKADRLHHSQHGAHAQLIEAMLADAVGKAAFGGASVEPLALAAIRATTEGEGRGPGGPVPVVKGIDGEGRAIALHPGRLPEDPAAFLAKAAGARPETGAGDYQSLDFRPPDWGDGAPPHMRLDRALEFLIGDHLG
ncbi:MAG: YcjX family protein [Pseudomonadota bacterium]